MQLALENSNKKKLTYKNDDILTLKRLHKKVKLFNIPDEWIMPIEIFLRSSKVKKHVLSIENISAYPFVIWGSYESYIECLSEYDDFMENIEIDWS